MSVLPFLPPPDGADLVLIAPFPKRPRGPTPDEIALVQDVVSHLGKLATTSPIWIDARNGSVTPAAVGEGQLRRRMIDCAPFNVRTPEAGLSFGNCKPLKSRALVRGPEVLRYA